MQPKASYETAMNACLLFVGAFLMSAVVDRIEDTYRYGIGALVILLSVWLAFWLGRWDRDNEDDEQSLANDILDFPKPLTAERFFVKKASGTDGWNVHEEGVGTVCFCFDDSGREAKIIRDLLNQRGGL